MSNTTARSLSPDCCASMGTPNDAVLKFPSRLPASYTIPVYPTVERHCLPTAPATVELARLCIKSPVKRFECAESMLADAGMVKYPGGQEETTSQFLTVEYNCCVCVGSAQFAPG